MRSRIQANVSSLKTLVVAWLAAGLVAGAGKPRADLPVLVLNDTSEPPFTTAAGDGFLDAVAGEAFRRAGVRLGAIAEGVETAERLDLLRREDCHEYQRYFFGHPVDAGAIWERLGSAPPV